MECFLEGSDEIAISHQGLKPDWERSRKQEHRQHTNFQHVAVVEFCLSKFSNTCKTEPILGNFQNNIVMFFALKNTSEINIFY